MYSKAKVKLLLLLQGYQCLTKCLFLSSPWSFRPVLKKRPEISGSKLSEPITVYTDSNTEPVYFSLTFHLSHCCAQNKTRTKSPATYRFIWSSNRLTIRGDRTKGAVSHDRLVLCVSRVCDAGKQTGLWVCSLLDRLQYNKALYI